MKTKKPFRKLTLTKQTITNLEDRQQDTIRGGVSGNTCIPCSVTSICLRCPITYRTVCTNDTCGDNSGCIC